MTQELIQMKFASVPSEKDNVMMKGGVGGGKNESKQLRYNCNAQRDGGGGGGGGGGGISSSGGESSWQDSSEIT